MLFKKSHSHVPNQFGNKSGTPLTQFGKKLQQANSTYKTIHNIADTIHKVKSILEK
jgi:predicted transcriptional regulator